MVKQKSSYEDLQKGIRRLKTPKIDVWCSQYPDKDYTVRLDNPEFTCVCPKTKLPDFANISLEYKPDKLCIELKSFKMYMLFFRDIGIFHEHLINKMLDDIIKACNPRYIIIRGEFNIRGGIKTTVTREYTRI